MIHSVKYWLSVINKLIARGLIVLVGMLAGLLVAYLVDLFNAGQLQSVKLFYLANTLTGVFMGGMGFWMINKEYSSPIRKLIISMKRLSKNDKGVRLPNDHLLKCWEITDCQQTQCPFYMADTDLRCWTGTREYCKTEFCEDCRVYQVRAVSEIGELTEVIHEYLFHVKNLGGQLDSIAANLEEDHAQIVSQINLFNDSGNKVARSVDQISEAAQTQVSTTEEAVSVMVHQDEDMRSLVGSASNMTQVINQTSTSIDQITRSIDEVASRVREVNSLADQATNEAREGGKAVVDVMCSMRVIQGKMDKLNEVLSDLGGNSKEIGNIIDTINQISAQTNLLALNAAIEAARAGEQGRGFAVVAEEVRKLAIRSSEATSVISEMIKAIQDKVEDTVEVATSGIEEVRSGATLVNAAGDTLEKIISVVRTTSQLMEEIARGTHEQNIGSEELRKGTVVMKRLSVESERVIKNQQTQSSLVVRAVEEMAMGAENIARQAMNISMNMAEQSDITKQINSLLELQAKEALHLQSEITSLRNGPKLIPPAPVKFKDEMEQKADEDLLLPALPEVESEKNDESVEPIEDKKAEPEGDNVDAAS